MRGVLPNPDRVLLPGYFVRVRVPFDQQQNALLVPDVALGSDQSGRYVLVVNGENVVEQRKVQTGPLEGDLRVIESGLKPDDRVVIAGLLRAIPGQKVDPQLQKIEPPPRHSQIGPGMISKFFIERPVLSNVIAILMILIGGVALFRLAVAQYPDVVPPTVQVTTRYPGASAKTVIDTVALPIEQQVNGVEDMLYMQSYSGADGTYTLTVTFKIGTDLNFAQVLVQNRVSSALSSLPQSVQNQGVTVQKKSTAILLFVTLTSPNATYDSLFLSNYATINIRDELSRLPGVGNVTVFGAGQYSMRVWLDPNKLQVRGLMPQDVIQAIQQQSQQVTAGQVGMPPTPPGQAFQYTLNVNGRLDDAEPVRGHHRQDRQQWRRYPRARRRPGRARRPDLQPDILAQQEAGHRHRRVPVARRQRARSREGGPEKDGGAGGAVSAGHQIRHAVRHHQIRLGLDP